MEKFDSICMLLTTIGKRLKKLDKVTNGELFPEYPEIEWKKVKGTSRYYQSLMLDEM